MPNIRDYLDLGGNKNITLDYIGHALDPNSKITIKNTDDSAFYLSTTHDIFNKNKNIFIKDSNPAVSTFLNIKPDAMFM